MKRLLYSLLLVVAFALPAFAGEGGEASGSLVAALSALGAGLAIGLAGAGAGIGQGHAVRGTQEAVARNPGISGKLTTTMFIGLAIIEALAIYGLVISLVLLFANPLL